MTRRVAFLAFVVLAFCGCREAPGDAVRRDVEVLMRRTLPNGVGVPQISMLHSGQTLEASWAFIPSVTWGDYRAWVADQLKADYSLKATSEKEVVFGRILPADAYRLTLRPDGTGVRADFVAMPF